MHRYLSQVGRTGPLALASRKHEPRRISQAPARHYKISAGVARELETISKRYDWPKEQLIWQAILTHGMLTERTDGVEPAQ